MPTFHIDDWVHGPSTVTKEYSELPPWLVAQLALDGDEGAMAYIAADLAKQDEAPTQ